MASESFFLVSQFLLPGLFCVPGFNFLLVKCLSSAGGFPALLWHEKRGGKGGIVRFWNPGG